MYKQIVGRCFRGPRYSSAERCQVIIGTGNVRRLGSPSSQTRFQHLWDQEKIENQTGFCLPSIRTYQFKTKKWISDGRIEVINMKLKLIELATTSKITRLEDPRIFYSVLDSPAPFAGMSYPRSTPWESLYDSGFRYVVCLTDDVPSYDPHPLEVLRSAHMEDLVRCRMPGNPAREQVNLREIVDLTTDALHAGNGVVVHCQGGTGRTGTVIACTLRQMGLAADDVLDYMRRVNVVREKYSGWAGWPESEWQRQQMMSWSIS